MTHGKNDLLEEKYTEHLGMISKVLGWQAMDEGEGAEAYIKACRSYVPTKGTFSTWLWHNLVLRRLQLNSNKGKHNNHVSLDDVLGAVLFPDTALIVERKDSFQTGLRSLNEDAMTIVRCLLEEHVGEIKRIRTKFPKSITATRRQIRKEIKEYCRHTLEWSWPRYWKAVHEIEEMLKRLNRLK